MSRITAYEATDGTLFKDKEAYNKHQGALNLLIGVSQIANTFCGNDVLNAEVAEFIVKNGEALKSALAGKKIGPVAEVTEVAPAVFVPIAEEAASAASTVENIEDGVDALVAELDAAA